MLMYRRLYLSWYKSNLYLSQYKNKLYPSYYKKDKDSNNKMLIMVAKKIGS